MCVWERQPVVATGRSWRVKINPFAFFLHSVVTTANETTGVWTFCFIPINPWVTTCVGVRVSVVPHVCGPMGSFREYYGHCTVQIVENLSVGTVHRRRDAVMYLLWLRHCSDSRRPHSVHVTECEAHRSSCWSMKAQRTSSRSRIIFRTRCVPIF